LGDTITNFPDSGAGLALVTQFEDGAIYLFALNADNSGANNQLNLYKLDLQNTQPVCTLIAQKDMQIPGMSDSITLSEKYLLGIPPPLGPILSTLFSTIGAAVMNSSFTWGKGLAVSTKNTIEVYASDRNVLSLSRIPLVGSEKDFSLVVWTNENNSDK
jgi:hypothetical protein